MRRLVLSPHPDDAVWSCAGLFDDWTRGDGQLTVATVFDGDTPTGPGEAWTEPGIRRREDVRALGRWGISPLSLRFPDAAFRRGEDGSPLYPSPLALRRAPHPEDAALTAAVATRLTTLLMDKDEVLVPLALNTHVDHRIVRSAVEQVLGSIGPDAKVRPCYYQEFPYGSRTPEGMVERQLTAQFSPWLRAALDYSSQVDAMFGSARIFGGALYQHAGLPSECVWHYWAFPGSASAAHALT